MATDTKEMHRWGEKCCLFIAFTPDETPEVLIASSSPPPHCHPTSSMGTSQPKTARQPILSHTQFWFLPSHSSLELLVMSQGKEPLRAAGQCFPREPQLLLMHSTAPTLLQRDGESSAQTQAASCLDKHLHHCKVHFFQCQLPLPKLHEGGQFHS